MTDRELSLKGSEFDPTTRLGESQVEISKSRMRYTYSISTGSDWFSYTFCKLITADLILRQTLLPTELSGCLLKNI